jgi:hypothetical protein
MYIFGTRQPVRLTNNKNDFTGSSDGFIPLNLIDIFINFNKLRESSL